MNKADKKVRKRNLAVLKNAGGQVKFNPASGVTVATMPSIGGERAKFGRVAIAVCSVNDKAKRKMGELLAMDNLFCDQSFPVKIKNWNDAGDWQKHVYIIFSEEGFL